METEKSSTMASIKANHVERIATGITRTYQDGKEYLCSKGYSPVEKGVYGSYLRSIGFKDLAKSV